MNIKASVTKLIHDIKTKPIATTFGSFLGVDENQPKIPVFPEWFFAARLGQPRQSNLMEIRTFARSPWVQMALNTIKKEVKQVPYEIITVDEDEDIENYQEQADKLDDWLNHINSNNETIYDLMDAAITDIGEIDAGIWSKVYSVNSYSMQNVDVVDTQGKVTGNEPRITLNDFKQRELLELWYADGASFLYDIDIFRRIRGYYQYSFKHPRAAPIFFYPDEITYFVMNRRSYTLYGFSPTQAAQQEIELMMQSSRYNKDFFLKNMMPDGIFTLEDSDEDSIEGIKDDWQTAVQGKPHKLLFINAKGDLHVLNQTNRDMEWLDGQKWYFHVIFGMFGMSPAEVGFHEDVNRSTQEGQERVTVKNAIKPYLELFEKKINTEIIPEFFQEEKPLIKIKFMPKDHVAEKIEFDQNMKEVEIGTMTPNEYRRTRGRGDVEGGDKPRQQQQFITFNGNKDNQDNQDKNNPDEEKDKDKDKKKSLPLEKPFAGYKNFADCVRKNKNKRDPEAYCAEVKRRSEGKSLEELKKDIDPGEDIIKESKSYDDFIVRNFDRWEKKAIAALNNIEIAKDLDIEVEKTFGEFLQALFNGITSLVFLSGVKKFVKDSMLEGHDAAEKDIDKNIDISLAFDAKVKSLSDQELNGYTIHGKKWHGMKGVTAELRQNILNSVRDGVINKESREQLNQRVKDLFGSAKDAQAERIARTEVNRFLNEGKLQSYTDSEIEGRKTWLIVDDDVTSDICKRLERKYGTKGIGFDEPFLDEKTGKEFMNPPAHPSCRSILGYALPD